MQFFSVYLNDDKYKNVIGDRLTVAGQAAAQEGERARLAAIASGASGYYDRGQFISLAPSTQEKQLAAAIQTGQGFGSEGGTTVESRTAYARKLGFSPTEVRTATGELPPGSRRAEKQQITQEALQLQREQRKPVTPQQQQYASLIQSLNEQERGQAPRRALTESQARGGVRPSVIPQQPPVIRRVGRLETGTAQTTKIVSIGTPTTQPISELQSKKIPLKDIQTTEFNDGSFGTKRRRIPGLDVSSLLNIVGKQKKAQKSVEFISESLKSAGRTIASPFIGVAKIGSQATRVAQAQFTPSFLKSKELKTVISPTRTEIIQTATDPDVINAAITAAFAGAGGFVSPLIPKIGITAIGAVQAVKTIKSPTPENVGASLAILPIAIGSGVSLGRQGFLRLTGTKVSPDSVFDVKVLSGEETFPKTSSVKESLQAFRKAPKLEGELQVMHATAERFGERVTTRAGEQALRGREDPGLFVTPANRASPFFLRIGTPPGEAPRVGILPDFGFTRPRLVQIGVKEVLRQPESVLQKGGFGVTQKFLESQAGKKKAFISKRSEASFRNLGVSGSRELEAVIPPGTVLERVPSQKRLFTTFRGEAVPIERFKILEGKVDRGGFAKVSKDIQKASRELESSLRESSKLRPSVYGSVSVGDFSKFLRSSKPSVPSRPSVPSIPSVPSKPSIPSRPSVPSRPSKPSVPSTPSIFSTSSTPSRPRTPSTPSILSTPSVVSFPKFPRQPGLPFGLKVGERSFNFENLGRVKTKFKPSLFGIALGKRIRVEPVGKTLGGLEVRGVPTGLKGKLGGLFENLQLSSTKKARKGLRRGLGKFPKLL